MTTQRVFLGAALLAVPIVLAACGGSDVVLPYDGKAYTTNNALTCHVSPDENICGRTFNVPQSDRANVVAFLQVVALFAGEAQSLLVRTFAACDAIAAEIDVHGVGLPEDSPTEKKKSGCAAVGKAYAALRPSLTVQETAPQCTHAPLPTCATTTGFSIPPLEVCNLPRYTVAVNAGATGDLARATLVAGSLQRHLPELGSFKVALEKMAQLSDGITNGSSLINTSSDPRTTDCIAGAAGLIKTAIDEVRTASEATTLVFAAP